MFGQSEVRGARCQAPGDKAHTQQSKGEGGGRQSEWASEGASEYSDKQTDRQAVVPKPAQTPSTTRTRAMRRADVSLAALQRNESRRVRQPADERDGS